MDGNSGVLMRGVVPCCLGVEEGRCCCGVGGGDGQTVALRSVYAEGFSVPEYQTDRTGSSYSDAPTEELSCADKGGCHLEFAQSDTPISMRLTAYG